MSSISTENQKHYYFSRAFQREAREPFPKGEEGWLAVDFYLVKQSRCWYDPAPTTTDDISCEISISGRSIAILFSCANHRRGYTDIMSGHISTMGLPPQEHPPILEKLFQVIQDAVPDRRVIVLMADVTLRFLGTSSSSNHHHHHHDNINRITREFPVDIELLLPSGVDDHDSYSTPGELCTEVYVLHDVDYHGINDRVTWESFETHRISFVPATRSSIHNLHKLRLDSLEEATIKHNPSCAICMDDFDQGAVDQLITSLPCTHHYHLDCIIQWLKTSHMCPMCRYPMPRLVADSGEGGSSNP